MLHVVEKNTWTAYDDHENHNSAGLQESTTLWGFVII